MNTKIILLALFFFSSLYSSAQSGLIKCTTQNNNDGSVSIYANNDGYGDYTIKFVFSALSGFSSRPMVSNDMVVTSVKRGYSEAMKFTRDRSSATPALSYRYSYFPGRSLYRQPDTTFEYLLPASAGNRVYVGQLSTTVSKMSQALKTDYRGTGISYKANDTICAARAGIVYECSDTAREGEKVETAYRSGRNRVMVQQQDGTLGLYGITAPIKLLVKPGDDVFPGQPIAVFNKEADRYRVYFSVCFLDEGKLLSGTSQENTQYYTYIPVVFCGSESERSSHLQSNKEYIVQHPKEIITAEMSKREKKKFGY